MAPGRTPRFLTQSDSGGGSINSRRSMNADHKVPDSSPTHAPLRGNGDACGNSQSYADDIITVCCFLCFLSVYDVLYTKLCAK